MRTAFYSLLAFAFMIQLFSLPAQAQSPQMETIAAVVNEDVISRSDLTDRMKLIIASSGMPDNADIREKMMPQIMNILTEEKLKMQEANRLELEVTETDVSQGFAALAGQNNMSAEQFRGLLTQNNVPLSTLHDQIRSQIAWSRVVQTELRPRITITDNEVDAVLSRLQASVGKTEYLVSEIFLPVEKPGDEADVRKLADRLTSQILEGRVPFQRVAIQFSQSAGASKGGDMGWIQEGQLPDMLDKALARMSEGDLSVPVRSLSGIHILYLRGKRTISEASFPSPDQLMQQLGNERLDRMQRRYLMDLKTQAFIENRV